jgi:hypothetical protein
MSRRGRIAAALFVAAGAVVAVAVAGVMVAGGSPTASTATASTTPTAASAAVPSATADPSATEGVEVDSAGVSADPQSGQTVATDAPVTVTGRTATVRITYAEWDAGRAAVVAGGLIAGVVEEGGTCRLTLTRAGQTVAVDAPVSPDAANTYCDELAVPGDRLAAGTWQAVLTYRSDRFTGTSPALDVEVAP